MSASDTASTLPDHPRDKVFSLPEICERISRSLDRAAITACSRVCQAWNSAWLPILWHTIDAGAQWNHPAFLDALSRHSDLLRILKCSRYDDISLLFNDHESTSHSGTLIPHAPSSNVLCRNLVTLVLPTTTLTNQSDHVRLIRQNPQLRDLSLSFNGNLSSRFADLIDAVGELQLLRRIAFDRCATLEVGTLETILSRRNGSLQELSLKEINFFKHPFGSGEHFASGSLSFSDPAATTAIEAMSTDVEIKTKETFGILSLSMDNVGCMQDLLLNLGSRFPRLSRLSFRETVETYFSSDFPGRLAKRCPNIKHLDISQTEDLDDSTIATLITSFPGLRTFKASETRFGNKSLTALVEVCRDLTVLEINATYGIQSRIMQQLLEQCWGLRQLDAWDVSVNVPDMMKEAYGHGKLVGAVDRRSMVSDDGSSMRIGSSLLNQSIPGQWACRGMESLVLRFDYDSSTLTEDEQRLFTPSKARRFVYEQLSKLTQLKYLAIGASLLDARESETESDYPDEGDETDESMCNKFSINTTGLRNAMSNVAIEDNEKGSSLWDQEQDDTNNDIWINYTIQSGLRQLSPLKDLRSLCLSAMDHSVGVPEIIWMTKNWPNLKSIEGLYEDEDEDVVKWLQEHRPDIRLDD
ncbi:hypothetical protein EDD11_005627 [Mortierella claussenii]|nr:hypothetical protein EDD11_005627 [Mortierella claussenii]